MNWHRAAQAWLEAGDRHRRDTGRALAGFACVYCGGEAQTADHVIARASGGRDDPDNLVPACRACNGSKGARSLIAWVEWMRSVSRRLDGAEAVLQGHDFPGDGERPIDPTDFDLPEFMSAWANAEGKQR